MEFLSEVIKNTLKLTGFVNVHAGEYTKKKKKIELDTLIGEIWLQLYVYKSYSIMLR
jgi:hypothetical protein